MKQNLLYYFFSVKTLRALALMQITSLSSLHAMDLLTEDHHDRIIKLALEKHNFDKNDFFEQDDVMPIYDIKNASLKRSIMGHEANLTEFQESVVASPLSLSRIHQGANQVSAAWDYFYYPRSFFSIIANNMPSMSWFNFSYFSKSNSSPNSPSSPLMPTNNPEIMPKTVNSTANMSLKNSSDECSYSVASLNENWRKFYLDKEETSSSDYLGLSMDGGGVRGLMLAMWIELLERLTNHPVSEIFHLIGGTSIGGIAALVLTTASEDGKTPKMRGSGLADLLENHSRRIFPPHTSSNPITKLWEGVESLYYNRYSSNLLEELLKEHVGESTLGNSLTRVLVTAVKSKDARPRIFDSSKVTDQIYKSWEIGLCTSAAPTYFPAHQLSADQEYYIDGGVIKNNPGLDVLEGLNEMSNFSLKKTTILSLGTGNMPLTPIPANAGSSSVGTIVSTIMRAQSASVEITLRDLLRDKDQYFRVNPTLERCISLDQLDQDSLRLLKEGAESQYGVIEEFIASEPVRRRLERIAL